VGGATLAHLRIEALLKQFKSMKKLCHNCGSGKGFREFIHGMRAGSVDEGKYEIGGCTESFADDSPTH
jgi:hypothetical protein